LKRLGILQKDSSRYQLLARLPEAEFLERVRAIRTANRQLSHAPFMRAANRFAFHHGRPTTSTASLLRRALKYLREVRALDTDDESKLAREVIHIAVIWQQQLRRRHAPVVAAERWSHPQRVVQCLLCGRDQPPDKPPFCPSCGGNWLEI
jgi:hypothetical protein